jgi:hypothetical protein
MSSIATQPNCRKLPPKFEAKYVGANLCAVLGWFCDEIHRAKLQSFERRTRSLASCGADYDDFATQLCFA